MVLFTSYSGAFGGAERLLLQFADGLGPGWSLACPEGALAQAARARAVSVWPLPSRSLVARGGAADRVGAVARLAAHGREIRRLVRDLEPELVIAWGMRSATAALLGPRLPLPVVFQHNDVLPGGSIDRLVRATAERAALTIALSETIAADLDPGRRLGERLQVVRPGVDVASFGFGREPAQPPEVLMLGALVGWKRPDLALEVCALARRTHPEMRLRLVGAPLADRDGELVRSLQERAAMADLEGAVEFAGAVAEPRDALARSTLLVHCAEHEPFGMAVLEALAAGRPAVVPAAGGSAEIVDESCGVLYEPGNARAAAAAISELLGDPERAAGLGAGGRERAQAEFDLKRSQERYVAAVRGVTRRRRGEVGAGSGLALVTVTHNSAPELEGLLRSHQQHLPDVPLIVVDAGSEDASVEIARRYEGITVVALGQNVGFGSACNEGLGSVRAPVTALINPDVELLDDSLLLLAAEAAQKDRPERLLAPLVLYPNGTRQDSVHPTPTSTADLLRSLVPSAALPGRVGVHVAPWRAARPRRVGWAVGCALVARTDTLRRLGPFDERIFLYGEDLELGLRAAEAGIETWFWPQARVLHHRAASTARAFGEEPVELLARTRREAIARRLGHRRALLDDAAQGLTFASRALVKWALGRNARRERRQLQSLRRARRERRPTTDGEL
jgi:GT2 family glycosyltransferase/glycosyltransferase involved in cell wall biosynthesis